MFPYQPIDKPIPAPGPNAGRLCFSFDAKWSPIIFGLLQTLLAEQTWASDVDHAISEAENLVYDFMLATECNPLPPVGGVEMEDCMGCCIRVQDGVIQVFSCGEWTDVPGGDLNLLIQGQKGQPTPGGEIPDNEAKQACVDVFAEGFTPLPFSVGPGFTLQVLNTGGQWSDGADTTFGLFDWYCANGSPTLTGDCIGVPHTESGDPLPSAPHMSLIGKIEPNIILFLGAGTVTIPSTATGDVLQLQANDSDLSDNTGAISVCFKITNSSAHVASLDLDSGSNASVDTPFNTTVGKTYKITISGRGVVGSGPTSFDAFYYDVSGTPVRATTSGSDCGFTNILELSVDGHEFSPIPAFDSGDVYVLYLLGTGAPFSFKYCDSNYTDNHGTFTILVEEQP
jgi:hypothetical protein